MPKICLYDGGYKIRCKTCKLNVDAPGLVIVADRKYIDFKSIDNYVVAKISK